MSEEQTAGEAERTEVEPPAEGNGKDALGSERQETGKAEEYLQNLIRLKADFDNYRRRTVQDQARWGEAAVAAFIVQLLPVVDNLERAMVAAGDAVAVRQGVEMTLRQFGTVLGGAGVTAMTSLGQAFDPARHEAVARGPAADAAPGTVVEEYRKGYLLRDQVLRPAMVRVAAEASEPPAGADGVGAAVDAAKEGER